MPTFRYCAKHRCLSSFNISFPFAPDSVSPAFSAYKMENSNRSGLDVSHSVEQIKAIFVLIVFFFFMKHTLTNLPCTLDRVMTFKMPFFGRFSVFRIQFTKLEKQRMEMKKIYIETNVRDGREGEERMAVNTVFH